MKIRTPIMARLIGPGRLQRDQLADRRSHWPLKWIDRANNQHWLLPVPAVFSKNFTSILRRKRLEGPCRIRSKFRGNSQLAQHGTRLFIARDNQRVLAEPRAHLANRSIHLTGFRAIAYGKLVFSA